MFFIINLKLLIQCVAGCRGSLFFVVEQKE